jgi:hypothetical protein
MRLVQLLAAIAALSFLGCGSSGGSAGDEDSCPAGTTLDVFAQSTTLTAGGPRVEIIGGLSNGCQAMVDFTLNGPGTLSPTSGIPVYYTPPASVATVTTATVTATAAGLTDVIVFTITPSASSVWTGTAVGPSGVSNSSGSISLAFASEVPAPAVLLRSWPGAALAAPVSVTGTFKSGSLTVSLTGTYDPSTRTFTVSGTGGGATYTFTGGVSAGGITGSFTMLVGSVSFPGTFTAAPGDSDTVTVYCGTYSGASSGTWNLVRTGASLNGIATTSGGNVPLSGTVSGSSVSISVPAGGGVTGTASGTISGTSIEGTWQIPGTAETGTFSGTTNC